MLWKCLPLLLLLGGCAGIISRPSPASLYQLSYLPSTVSCAHSFSGNLRIWSLEAIAPYNRDPMVVLSSQARVELSPQHRWIAQPGQMLADWLMRDLARQQLFSAVSATATPFNNSYDLGGQLFVFGWQRQPGGNQAVLDCELTLVARKPERKRQILMRKRYQLASPASSAEGPEAFAQAMSALVQQLAQQCLQDLCMARDQNLEAGGQ